MGIEEPGHRCRGAGDVDMPGVGSSRARYGTVKGPGAGSSRNQGLVRCEDTGGGI